MYMFKDEDENKTILEKNNKKTAVLIEYLERRYISKNLSNTRP